MARRHLCNLNAACLDEAIGALTPNCDIVGLSKGQFSLIQLITYCLRWTGPAAVDIGIWTAGARDIAHALDLFHHGAITRCRWVVDFSFPNRHPAYCEALRAAFGDHCIATTAIHAKFIVISNDDWNIVIRSSMNLNWNRRIELYEITDDADFAAYLKAFIDAAFATGDTIVTAHENPSAVQQRVTTLHGDLETMFPRMSFAPSQDGVDYA